ncbi:hypothetical protein ACIGXM_29095 [Kitasatospora sp. NPDC052896]|uniref:hypothetical protein n=1 Tax=Kitasatospora sp. NPDC052896 TaxID=3364061 RepID=UPI0037CAE246
MPEQKDRSTAGGGRRIELSVAQVVASALAAVVGAVLASELGVYGTIIGAAVVSIGATTGGAVFQHLFRRTGEQLREVADRGPGRAVNDLKQVPLTDTAPLPEAWRPAPEPSAEWSDPLVLKARRRWTWRGYALVSALVFALAMTPIVIVELAAGKNLHSMTTGQDGGGTSFFPGGGHRSDPAPPATRPADQPDPGPSAGGGATPSTGAGGGVTSGSTPSGVPSARVSPSGQPSPSTSPAGTPTVSPTPTPSAGSPSAAPSADPATAAPPAATPGATASP